MTNLQLFPVLLPTEDASQLGIRKKFDTPLTKVGGLALLAGTPESTDKDWEYLHLHLTSQREIKEGEYYIDTFLNEIRKCKNPKVNNPAYSVILFTTDPKIADGVPAIPDFCIVNNPDVPVNFLEEFVKRYNDKNEKRVDVEKLAEEKYKNRKDDAMCDIINLRIGFEDGYNQCLQDNADKMKQLLEWVDGELKTYRIVPIETESEKVFQEVKEKILSITPTKQVEIKMWCEMEEVLPSNGNYMECANEIKLTNGQPIIYFDI